MDHLESSDRNDNDGKDVECKMEEHSGIDIGWQDME